MTLLWVSCWVPWGLQVCPRLATIVVSLERLQTQSACPGWVCCPWLTLCRGTPPKPCSFFIFFPFIGERKIAYSMQRLKLRALCDDIRSVRGLLGSPLVHEVPMMHLVTSSRVMILIFLCRQVLAAPCSPLNLQHPLPKWAGESEMWDCLQEKSWLGYT